MGPCEVEWLKPPDMLFGIYVDLMMMKTMMVLIIICCRIL
jgi:hypothetical protein